MKLQLASDLHTPLLRPWPDVWLAVHSTWRYLYRSGELREFLGSLGPRFIGAVPRGPRAESIFWLLHLNAAITSHLVLDDAPHEFRADFPDTLVVCESLLGLSAWGVKARVEAWLAGEAS